MYEDKIPPNSFNRKDNFILEKLVFVTFLIISWKKSLVFVCSKIYGFNELIVRF